MQTSWGSRADGDANDEQRLSLAPRQNLAMKTPLSGGCLIRYNDRARGQHEKGCEKQDYATYDSSTSYVPIRLSTPLRQEL